MSEERRQPSSIQKAFDILNIFTREMPVLSLDRISEISGIPKTTVFRILGQLEENGYVTKQDQLGKIYYSLGFAYLEKGQLVKDRMDIREMVRGEMLRLRNEMNLTIQLAIRDNQDAVYIEQFESWRPIRVFPAIGKRVPLYSAACPRVLLAYTEKAEQQWLMSQYAYEKFTENTIIDQEQLTHILTEIQFSGYSVSRGELYPDTYAIAVPIIHPVTNECLAAMSIIGMETDFGEKVSTYVTQLKDASANVFT